MSADKEVIRCAIYTRKSSEEGLDQSFNSLHAQREACEAFIVSQRHEGWTAAKTHFDDGGYSGGTMDRPALGRLLEEIAEGKVDSVVVYKVDRLTRSLADFAKIIERFDGHSVSFVSVTQQFNTTSSMGRLTLNVLLSFAQFEREVTGERIRDKIAASKRKGMWMGGNVPLGYDLRERKLYVNEREAEIIRRIYKGYVQLKCVSKLQQDLRRAGIRSKIRSGANGGKRGGSFYSRGALYRILQNRIYLGEISHRGAIHKGEHRGLVDAELWGEVQKILSNNGGARRNGTRAKYPSLLTGLIFNSDGVRLTPTHSLKHGKRFRYYAGRTAEGLSHRVSIAAPIIEEAVISQIGGFLASANGPFKDAIAGLPLRLKRKARDAAANLAKRLTDRCDLNTELIRGFLSRVTVDGNDIEIELDSAKLRSSLVGPDHRSSGTTQQIRIEASIDRVATAASSAALGTGDVGSASLIKAICRGHLWLQHLANGEVRDQKELSRRLKLNARYVSRILGMSFLSPRIVERILAGNQERGLTLESLRNGIPVCWAEQEAPFALQARAKGNSCHI